jgi:AcrR family transcriptional regulator
MPGPSYTRLDVDERRRQLLETGARVFTERAYDDVSMADVAREAGISKGLLYHYFPSKRDFFSATLEAAASELRALTDTDSSLPPIEQLRASLDSYLAWIDANAPSYRKLIESAASTAEARSMVDRVRHETVERMLAGLVAGGAPAPALRTALHGWLWSVDGACLDWLEHRDIERDQLRELLIGSFAATIMAAASAAGVELALG